MRSREQDSLSMVIKTIAARSFLRETDYSAKWITSEFPTIRSQWSAALRCFARLTCGEPRRRRGVRKRVD